MNCYSCGTKIATIGVSVMTPNPRATRLSATASPSTRQRTTRAIRRPKPQPLLLVRLRGLSEPLAYAEGIGE